MKKKIRNLYRSIKYFSFYRKFINFYCEGWSTKNQWSLFHKIFKEKKYKTLAILGIYRRRDLGYICRALKKSKNIDCKIYAIDLFD